VRTLPDGWVDEPEPLFPSEEGTPFLVTVTPLILSDISPGTHYKLKR